MSVRLDSTPQPKRWPAALLLAVAGGFACGLLTAERTADAQPTSQTKDKDAKGKGTEEEADAIDKRPPVPADTPARKAFEKLQIKDRDRAIFAEIEDFKPVAAQNKNPREYDAWIEFVQHAKAQTARDLDEFGIRDLVPLDFARMPKAYRTELVRFDGKLVCVRRLVSPPVLRASGVPELYEARLVPVDESPLTPVSIVFLDLPETLAAVKNKAPEEWLDADGWVAASGYFFKTMSVPGEKANAVVQLPLLIGKSLTPLPGAPAGNPAPTALDKNVRVYKFIRDDTRLGSETPWAEIEAYNRILLHAARFPAEDLERDANGDVRFADLFEDTRASHRLSLVKFEGRLISLAQKEPNEWLAAAGVKRSYEGWLVPQNEPRGNPIRIDFTEPPEGVEPGRRVNKWVSFAGYSFKRLRYESAEEDPKNPSKHLDKLAPLVIGKKPLARTDPDTVTSPATWGAFINGAVIAGALLILSAGAFTWWYRRGDRRSRSEMATVRGRNPFDPNAPAPAE